MQLYAFIGFFKYAKNAGLFINIALYAFILRL